MTLKDYVENPQLAIAREIYNNKCNSPEEVMSLLTQIDEETHEFKEIIHRFTATLHNIKYCTWWIDYWENKYRKLNEFKKSRIGNLIREYINNNTEELLNEIKREIEISGNPFGVEFREGENSIRARGVKGELAYGTPKLDFFDVKYTETFYTTNNWDIDEDVDVARNAVEQRKQDKQEWIDEKISMHNMYQSDLEALMLLFEQFQEEDPFGEQDIVYF